MSTLGEDLRREREQRSLTLREISDRTKIGYRHLEALENGRTKSELEPFFVKGMLRSYAKVLGLPEDHFLAAYRAEAGPIPEIEAKPKQPAPELKPPRRKPVPRHKLRRAVVIALALILTALLVIVYLFILRPAHGRLPSLPAAPEAKAAAPGASAPAASPGGLPPVLDTRAAETAGVLALRMTFTADTWMHVTADGVVRMEGTKKAGESAGVDAAREIIIHTGNAGGFAFTLNGRPAKPLGALGAVLTDVRINRETLAGFLAAPETAPAGIRDR